MELISQLFKQENNVNNRLLIQPTLSITITRLNSKEVPEKRGLLANEQTANDGTKHFSVGF
ncbi:hypothetical protein BpHYR1_041716 [Brachionus plicatilis]|uniref:Uncharacterized protein n=1 Tax=Brachionus plicatilis TaxID=10195 RepID=A0A3M7PXW7_BRAPC|nr:hypothetical protein BpHYR1_041716 [Brachionus plicatilis]